MTTHPTESGGQGRGKPRPAERYPALRGRCAMDAADFGVRALVFDVFGTVVDWRGSVAEAGRALGQRRGIETGAGDP